MSTPINIERRVGAFVFAGILVTCALGLLFYFAVAHAERLSMPWRLERGEV